MTAGACVDCGAVLQGAARSPRCPRCWSFHQRARNRANVQAYRSRIYATRDSFYAGAGGHLPSEQQLEWLDWTNLGIAEQIREMWARLPPDGNLDAASAEFARAAIELFRTRHGELIERAALRPDSKPFKAYWEGFFRRLEEVVQ